MTNKEFVNAVKDGNITKVKKGIKDPKVNPTAWNSRALKYAFDELVHNNGDTKIFGEMFDILIQNTDVDPSIETFIVPWVVKYSEYKTIEKVFNHPNIVSNTSVWRHSGQTAENVVARGREDISNLLLKQKFFKIDEALSLATFGNDALMAWAIENGANVKSLDASKVSRVLDNAYKNCNTKLIIKLFTELNLPKSYNNAFFALRAVKCGDEELIDFFKNDPEVMKIAATKGYDELLSKEAVDLFLF